MPDEPRLDSIFAPSEDVVARVIEGELLLIPLVAGVGGEEDELFTFNDTGRAAWQLLDGRRNLRSIASELVARYDAPAGAVERDLQGLVGELLKRRMVAEIPA